METEILKLYNKDKSSIFRVKPTWKENCFEIVLILEDLSAWSADITEEQLTKLAKERSQNVNDYYRTIKKYFYNTEPDISFDLKQINNSNENNMEFMVKLKGSSRTIIFFSINLHKVEFQQFIFNLIDEVLEQNIALNKELDKFKEKEVKLISERKLYEDKLTEFVELKTNWEQEMYSNFLILLNEKKKRINYLTNLLTHKNINPDMQVTKESNYVISPASSPLQEKCLETISDSGTNTDYETDKDDNSMDCDDNADPKPSTSKEKLEINKDTFPKITKNLNLEIEDPALSHLSLPKIAKKHEKQNPKIIKETLESTEKIFTQETQEVSTTQEPYLSTQEMIDRM